MPLTGDETGAEAPASAWNPGVGTGIPAEFRALETIFRPQCVCAGIEEIDEFAALTRLPQLELTAFRPQRLALHEIIIRVTADITVAEGDEEEDFGRNFRRIASKIHDDHVLPHMDGIADAWADLGRRSAQAATVTVAVSPTLSVTAGPTTEPPPTATRKSSFSIRTCSTARISVS